MKTIAVLNATRVSLEPVDAAAKEFPDIKMIHLMDECMSELGKSEGRISGKNLARMVSLINKAEEFGVDGMMMSCTIFSPYVDLLRSFTDLPLVAADVAMFEEATRRYKNIGVVVTFEPTMDSVAAVLDGCRQRIGPIEAELKLAEGAFEAMRGGDAETHNRRIYETALSLATGKDAIVLSQMSQMRALPLFEGFPLPVLTSPPVSLQVLSDMIDARK